MGVLGAALAAGIALAGCYAPSVRDCTVSCGSASDCTGGQVCGSDGKCAAPEVAGRCAGLDAGARDDAAPADAAAPRDAGPDAAASVALRVQIMGKGSVVLDGGATCSSQDAQHGNCLYDIAAGVPHTMLAVDLQTDEVFQMWTSIICAGQGRRCTFTALAPAAIAARFGKTGMHDAP